MSTSIIFSRSAMGLRHLDAGAALGEVPLFGGGNGAPAAIAPRCASREVIVVNHPGNRKGARACATEDIRNSTDAHCRSAL